MLSAIAPVVVIGLARVLIWFADRQSHRFTVGMFTIAGAGLLFLEQVGEETVDPALHFAGANTSNLLVQLLTIIGLHLIVTGLADNGAARYRLRHWKWFTIAATTTVTVSYLAGDRLHTSADLFALADTWSLVGYWAFAVALAAMFAIAAVVATSRLREPGIDLRLAMLLILLMSMVGAAVGVAVAWRLATDPGWLRTNYRTLAAKAMTPAYLALAASGTPSLWRAWKRRHDPQ